MMRAYPLLGFLIIALFVGCCGKKNMESATTITGTIKLLPLEGGFYGIAGDDGVNYDPINLADEFKQDGLRVKVIARERNDMAGFHMWGKYIEILEIKPIK
jgi:inhibitor of cysteine peptidase